MILNLVSRQLLTPENNVVRISHIRSADKSTIIVEILQLPANPLVTDHQDLHLCNLQFWQLIVRESIRINGINGFSAVQNTSHLHCIRSKPVRAVEAAFRSHHIRRPRLDFAHDALQLFEAEPDLERRSDRDPVDPLVLVPMVAVDTDRSRSHGGRGAIVVLPGESCVVQDDEGTLVAIGDEAFRAVVEAFLDGRRGVCQGRSGWFPEKSARDPRLSVGWSVSGF